MIKSLFVAATAMGMAAAPALAGPYVNVEANSGFVGSDYQGTVTDFHVGYEGDLGESAGYYVQMGPSLVTPDDGDADTVFSGKTGIGVDLSEKLSVYGEVSFATGANGADNGYGTKLEALTP